MVNQNNTHKTAEEGIMNPIVGDESFAELFEAYIAFEKEEGTIVKGKVIAVDHDSVYIDVGLKSEGRVPKREFLADELEALEVGSEVDVFLEKYEAR